MGIVVVKESSTGNPAMEALAAEAAGFGEEAEIKEIIHPEEEKVAPQCVRIARKRGDEWVFYEEDHSDRAVRKLQRTIEDLMGQIKVRALEPRSCPSSFCSEIAVTDTSLYCRALKKHRSIENGVSTQLSRQWKKTRP
jgi:dissimilatory sulfite reductase (desulfoviridin) alpha/beta subunit